MLDTDILSYIIKRTHPGVHARLTSVDSASVLVSVIVQAELLYGLQPLPRDHYLHNAVYRFLDEMPLQPWDSDAAEVHARIRHRLITSGQTIGEMDTMIAAHAISLGTVLVTNNTRHFGRLPELRLENWTIDP
jgi:tRNA(fMet)-specific endonuclease VapC